LYGEKLLETKAFAFQSENKKNVSKRQMLDSGNMQDVKSEDVIRKILSEALMAGDYAQGDLEDLLVMYSDKDINYLGHVGLPAYFHVYSIEQLHLLKSLDSTKPVTGYLDATGTVVRKADRNHKRVLYYALVTSFQLPYNSSINCAIVEMVSSAHDICVISQWLCAFKAFALKNKPSWSIFTNVVTDFSFAQMHALSIAFNGFNSIFDYLNWCFRILYENIDLNGPKFTIINVCANHYTKIIVDHVYGHYQTNNENCGVKKKERTNQIINWICLLFNCILKHALYHFLRYYCCNE